MIFETIELITKELLTVNALESRINNGEFDDILISHPFLIMTDKGLCLVRRDENGVDIKFNTVVDLSEYIKSNDLNTILANKDYVTSEFLTQEFENKIPDVTNFVTNDKLNDYVKTDDLPIFSFLENGNLSITINGVTKIFAPIVND